MAQGWVYVLVNSSIPGMAKVGHTHRPPAERAAELSAVTGVATPFVLAFDQQFVDCVAAEGAVHAELDRRGLRVAPNREFFRGSPSDIIHVVLGAAAHCPPVPPAGPDPSAETLRLTGDRLFFGLGDTLQDTGEAIRCYRLAAARGSLLASERLGRIYRQLYVARCDRAGRRRALTVLKDGARLGNYYCYVEMAMLFAAERHCGNFAKAWALFFTGRAASRQEALEQEAHRFGLACGDYIGGSLELGVPPSHLGILRDAADDILAALLAARDAACDRPSERWRITTILRWSYETLLPRLAPSRLEKGDTRIRLQKNGKKLVSVGTAC